MEAIDAVAYEAIDRETTRYREKSDGGREEVSVIEVYWQLILRAGCARFVGHDTLPSQRATGKPGRDVLRRPTESNVRPSLCPSSRRCRTSGVRAVRLCQPHRKRIVPRVPPVLARCSSN